MKASSLKNHKDQEDHRDPQLLVDSGGFGPDVGDQDDQKLHKMASHLGLKRSETSRLVRKVTKLMLENEKKREK
jgi:hypothetical protein